MTRIGSQQHTAITAFIRDIDDLTTKINDSNTAFTTAEGALTGKIDELETHEKDDPGPNAATQKSHDRTSAFQLVDNELMVAGARGHEAGELL